MANRVFKGLEYRPIVKEDEKYGHLAGSYGLHDVRSGTWMHNCFSRKEENIVEMHETASKVLASPVGHLLHLHEQYWDPWDDNYIPWMFLEAWLQLNPDALQEFEKIAAAQLKKKHMKEDGIKPRRGRPRKSETAGVSLSMPKGTHLTGKVGKRGRGRPRKDATEVKISKPKSSYKLKEISSDAAPRKRGRPRKEPVAAAPAAPAATSTTATAAPVKRGRGRPRKNP